MENTEPANVSFCCALKTPFVINEISNLLGQILTIVDASTEGEKNIAMKSLIKERFGIKQDYLNDFAYKQIEDSSHEGHNPRNHWEDSLVPYEMDKRYSFR